VVGMGKSLVGGWKFLRCVESWPRLFRLFFISMALSGYRKCKQSCAQCIAAYRSFKGFVIVDGTHVTLYVREVQDQDAVWL